MAGAKEESEAGLALADLPGHLLRRCHQISVALFLDECAQFDITPLQFGVLNTLLEHGPQDQATIGRLAALDRTTVAVVIQKLAARDLLKRVQSDRDKRSKIVTITKSGRVLVADASAAVLRAQSRTVAPLTQEEQTEFLRLMNKLAQGNNAQSRAPMTKRREE